MLLLIEAGIIYNRRVARAFGILRVQIEFDRGARVYVGYLDGHMDTSIPNLSISLSCIYHTSNIGTLLVTWDLSSIFSAW